MTAWSEAGDFLVLGATGSIGTAVTEGLVARGAQVVVLGRDEARLAELASRTGARQALLPGIDPGSVRDALRAAAQGRPVAGIAHCIGSLHLQPAHRTTPDEWQRVLDSNLSSAFGVTMAVPDLFASGGTVVFVSSVAARVGLPNHEAIAAAKAGLEGLARAAAATHARRGVRFHCVAPALVQTRMTAGLLSRAGMLEACNKANPSGRIGQPGDIANAILFLLDPANNWIDGQVLGVDGGFGALRGNA